MDTKPDSDGLRQDRPGAAQDTPRPATTAQLLAAFRLAPAWATRLRQIDRHPWLQPLLLRRGRPASRHRPAASHLWHPVRFAQMLMQSTGLTAAQAEAGIAETFPQWLASWREARFDLIVHELDSEQ